LRNWNKLYEWGYASFVERRNGGAKEQEGKKITRSDLSWASKKGRKRKVGKSHPKKPPLQQNNQEPKKGRGQGSFNDKECVPRQEGKNI